MRRPNEPADTVLHNPSSQRDDASASPDEDRTLAEQAPSAAEGRSAEDDRTQFVDASQFLNDRTEVLRHDRDTVRMPGPDGPNGGDDPAEATIVDPCLASGGPQARATDEATHSERPEGDATVIGGGPDSGGDTTFLGPPGGPTILTPAARRSPDRGDPRTLRPAGSKTIIEGPDGSATLAQMGAGAKAQPVVADSNQYEFLEELAQGGMGRIWRAADLRIRREVAFKELLPDALREPEAVERFVEEAQVTGQLEHPSIVPVYELGRQENGTPFYSMKLVAGSTLRDAIQEYHALPAESRERRLAFVKLLRNLVAVCNAIGFAHERGVLHRDLKPLNIMLGDFGETLVLDWGMAKVLSASLSNTPEETATAADGASLDAPGTGNTTRTELELSQPSVAGSPSLHSQTRSGHSTRRHSVQTDGRSAGTETQMGSIMGTPNYMAPEQALGLVDEFDARTDIYSLGAILYEILTGRPPVPKGKITEKLKYIIEGRTPPPRDVDATIPRPLEAICLKAMARRKDERYETALMLASDVEAFLADEPVTVYADPLYTRARRWAKRHRTVVAATAAVIVVAVAAFAAWSVVESGRIASAEHFVREQMAAASAALDRDEFEEAERVLDAAGVRLADMPKLAALRHGVEVQQDSVRQLRREYVEQEVQQRVSAADAAVVQEDYASASSALTEAFDMTRGIPDLQSVQQDVARRRVEVAAAAEAHRARDKAQVDFARFEELADRARVFGSLFREENPQQDAAVGRDAAMEALSVFGLNTPHPLQALPASLAEAQIAQIRQSGYELCYMLAQMELTLAWDTQGAEREKVGERSLQWIAQAKRFGLNTKALLSREGGILEWLGRGDDARRVRELYDETPATLALDHYLLGEVSRVQGDYAAALEHYSQALHVQHDYFWATFSAGRCHLEGGEYEAAVVSFTGCAAIRPDLPYTYGLRALARAALRRYEAAEADFDRALASPHPLADSLFRMGMLLNRGAVRLTRAITEREPQAIEQAIADFQAAAELQPERADPHLNLARAYWQQAEEAARAQGALSAAPIYEKALQAATAAAARAPITAAAYVLRGIIHLQVGDTRQAVGDLQRAVDLSSSSSDRARAHVKLGQIYQTAGDQQTALANYDAAIDSAPHYPETYFLRGEVRKALRRNRDAAADFVKFLELLEGGSLPSGLLDPTPEQWNEMLARAYRWRGELLASGGDYRQALPDYIRSHERDPDSAELLTRRGWAYVEKGLHLAEADFADAIEANPRDADPWNGRGYARVMQGRYQEAVLDAERALELARKQIAAGENLGWALLFNSACIYAQAVDRVEEDRAVAADERATQSEKFASRAIELLQEAEQTAGAAGRAAFQQTLRGERALDPIRDREAFRGAWGDGQP